jgi:hypothetical protein
MLERRRTPRHVLQPEGSLAVSVAVTVRILDISVAGVLLHTSRPVLVGQRGSLRLTIGGHELTTEVAVTRVSPAAGVDSGYRVGAAFQFMAPEYRQIIERFTNQ